MFRDSAGVRLAALAFAFAAIGLASVAAAGEAERLYALGLSNDAGRAEVFAATLGSRDLAVRRAAASGLVFASSPAVLPAIEAAMSREKSTFVRRCLIEAAARAKGPKATAILESALRDADEINRLAAAERLLRLGPSTIATRCVLQGLESSSREAVLMACEIAGTYCLAEAAGPLKRIALGEENGGENSRDLLALRALCFVARRDAAAVPQALEAARGKIQTPSSFQRVEVARILGEFGEKQDLPVLHGWLSGQWAETQYPCALGLARLKDPSSSAALARTLNETGKSRMKNPQFFKIPVEYIRALVAIGESSAIEPLKQYASSLPERTEKSSATQSASGSAEPGDRIILPNQILRVHVAWARWSLGDASAEAEFKAYLGHEDASVRREAVKCLERLAADRMTDALKSAFSDAAGRESEPYTRTAFQRVAAAKGLTMPPRPPPIPTSQAAIDPADNAPRYLLLNFDDCATLSALERLVEMTDLYAAQGSRFVSRLMVAPGSRFDQDYLAVLLKRLYDRGYEIGNHSFYHNNDGWDFYRLSEHEMESEFKQCMTWLRDYVPGLRTVHAFWPGGSGFRPQGKPPITRGATDALAAQWGLAADPPYRWPEVFEADFCAPPYHDAKQYVSWSIYGDLSVSHMLDSAEEGIESFKASFEAYYAHPERMAFFMLRHDWPLGVQEIRPGTRLTYPVFRSFMDWAMVDQKARFKDLRCVTPLEMVYIMAGREKELDPAKGHIQSR